MSYYNYNYRFTADLCSLNYVIVIVNAKFIKRSSKISAGNQLSYERCVRSMMVKERPESGCRRAHVLLSSYMLQYNTIQLKLANAPYHSSQKCTLSHKCRLADYYIPLSPVS